MATPNRFLNCFSTTQKVSLARRVGTHVKNAGPQNDDSTKYRTLFRTSTGATPYSLVYGMEAALPVEIEMGSLRVTLDQQISETEWAQSLFD